MQTAPTPRSSDVIALLDKIALRNSRDVSARTLMLEDALQNPLLEDVVSVPSSDGTTTFYPMTKPQLARLLMATNFESWQPHNWLEFDENGLKGCDKRLDTSTPMRKEAAAYDRLVATTLRAVDILGGQRKRRYMEVDFYIYSKEELTYFLSEARFDSWSMPEWEPSVRAVAVKQAQADRAAQPKEPPPPFPGLGKSKLGPRK